MGTGSQVGVRKSCWNKGGCRVGVFTELWRDGAHGKVVIGRLVWWSLTKSHSLMSIQILRQAKCLVHFLNQCGRELAHRSQNIPLWNGVQVVAFDNRRIFEIGRLAFGGGRVNQDLSGDRCGELDVAADHGDDGVIECSIVVVSLDDERRTLLGLRARHVRKINDDDIASVCHTELPSRVIF